MRIHFSRPSGIRLGVLLAVGIVAAACGGAASGPQIVGSAVDNGQAGAPSAAPAQGSGTDSNPGPLGSNPNRVLEASRLDLQIIKTGTMNLQVTSVEDALNRAEAKISALGGYVSGSQQSGEGDSVSASVTYRMPVDRWTDALVAMRALAIKVLEEKTDTQDVTGQVVDLGARITNLQATERALQQIMDKATKITDVLAVQAELTKVRGDIEQATAEKQHLTEQASFSTLTVGFGLKPEAAVVISQQKFDPKSEVDRASAAMVDILQGLATAGIWFAIVWLPILLSLGLLALLAIYVYRRGRPHGGAAPGGLQPPSAPVDAPSALSG